MYEEGYISQSITENDENPMYSYRRKSLIEVLTKRKTDDNMPINQLD